MPQFKSAFVGRLSGIVTFSDNSSEQFAVAVDDQGNISYNNSSESLDAVKQVGHANSWLQTMFTALATASASANHLDQNSNAPTVSKTVTGLVATLSGRVSITNPGVGKPSWQDFSVEYSTEHSDSGALGAFIPPGSTDIADGSNGDTAWDYIWTDFQGQVTTWLSGLGINWN